MFIVPFISWLEKHQREVIHLRKERPEKRKERHECDGVSGVSEEFRSCLFSADSLGGDLG